ncbi:MAG: PQQ-dependent dehydrogenase, methanol/ethanol family [Proteobacteria bacterium]|nr:PQQ-dependent dehydrogenase, methanol/ethanol family [Pseudomonadota bacterium]
MTANARSAWFACLLSAAAQAGEPAAAPAREWRHTGGDAQGSYYSPLQAVNDRNVASLGHAWTFVTGTTRGLEATPLVVDGVMYTSGNWGIVYALDAATGRSLWTFTPRMDRSVGRNACCDVVNRGVVVANGRVYVGALDGRLYALEAKTGAVAWSADTIVDHTQPYSSTGAPQLAGDVVLIGNSGADMGKGGTRGYVSAYDLATGGLAWRFWVVPRRDDPHPSPAMQAALKTWDPASDPRGGAVWAGTAYDPQLNLVYIGTGNAAPYENRIRNPGGGRHDDLYCSSIVALDARSGERRWHFQTTPGDDWDQDAAATLVQADLQIGGRTRQVLLQASKNGFFYALDRRSGELISGKPFTYINWARGLDAKGRPILNPVADYSGKPQLIYPSTSGGHSWAPMSLSAQTHLVYIPVFDVPMIWVDLGHKPVTHVEGSFGVGVLYPDASYDPVAGEELYGKLPHYDAVHPRTVIRNVLRAWDPVAQKSVWEQETSNGVFVNDGGVLSTGGNLVFQGRADGKLYAYAADSGKLLHTIDTGVGIMAAPMTYEAGGVQYVAVMAGYGGGAIASTYPEFAAGARYRNEGRIVALKLGGEAVPLPALRTHPPLPTPPPREGSQADIARGLRLFTSQCGRCHALGVSVLPDLRTTAPADLQQFEDIVLHGALAPLGMARFDDVLTEEDARALHAYLVSEAWTAYEAARAKSP